MRIVWLLNRIMKFLEDVLQMMRQVWLYIILQNICNSLYIILHNIYNSHIYCRISAIVIVYRYLAKNSHHVVSVYWTIVPVVHQLVTTSQVLATATTVVVFVAEHSLHMPTEVYVFLVTVSVVSVTMGKGLPSAVIATQMDVFHQHQASLLKMESQWQCLSWELETKWKQVMIRGLCSFTWIVVKFCWASDLCSIPFHIYSLKISHSNSIFCCTYITKFQQNELTPCELDWCTI